MAGVPELAGKILVAGVVDGRNIWRTDLEAALGKLATLLGSAGGVAVSTSCSTLHVPYSLEPETGPGRRRCAAGWRSDARRSPRSWRSRAPCARGATRSPHEIAASNAAVASRTSDPRLHNGHVRARIDSIVASGAHRGRRGRQRRASQDARLQLPPLPTTTIGSFPQTSAIRKARAALRAGEIDEAEYAAADEGRDRRRHQAAGGASASTCWCTASPSATTWCSTSPSSSTGFFATQNGWVQSYGSRCVRPPILYGDVARPHPMTVEWITYAQSLTDKPVKGMLTGPVTILAWSFVRDDQPLADTANQVALAIRDETVDLQAAGIAIIQVDEPALRELLPLRRAGPGRLPALGGRRLPAGHVRCRRLHADPHPPVLLGVR